MPTKVKRVKRIIHLIVPVSITADTEAGAQEALRYLIAEMAVGVRGGGENGLFQAKMQKAKVKK